MESALIHYDADHRAAHGQQQRSPCKAKRQSDHRTPKAAELILGMLELVMTWFLSFVCPRAAGIEVSK